jgi:hypothetical protein
MGHGVLYPEVRVSDVNGFKKERIQSTLPGVYFGMFIAQKVISK